ncbi:acetyl-CoA carboxylase biotin carboxyl carrier protein [Paraburkholderia phenoliruptrix]|uniref:acetyl-CoA carboxylase biotin carboxyl carrier protein n=1 Tax=Paraburkholderia phenoliruptrix TaxID=252970 RepID=UPI002859D7F8|nr:acetyl-CoA carboxylase biotin carboxyl carrier protein [Paraburkholderia phenoliruptrix]MDR6392509.1 acetyl-CoA carboxylase biotin carboxyl carrier protein [Paraburkholderia phenoliruptrix]
MDLQKIKALIDLLADSPLAKLEVIEGDARVKLVKAKRGAKQGVAHASAAGAPVSGAALPASVQSGADEAARTPALPFPAPSVAKEPHCVRAPMFGVVHLTPAPGEPPFVTPGDTIGEGQVLCTIEAMKMFNAIEAETGGAILEVLVAPGSEVEPGQPLFRIG